MTAYYNEIDPQAAQWLRNLIAAGMIAPGDVDERSIIDVRPDDLRGYTQCHFFAGIGVWSYALRQAGWSDDRPVWTGSCPCQPFSSAGKSGGFDDPRHLWPSFAWLIEQCKPPVIFGEQVASKAVEPWIDLVQTDLEAMGYAFGGIPFPSAGVGAPHIRDRLFWVGHTDQPGPQGHARHGGAERWEGQGGSATSAGVSGGLADDELQQRPAGQSGIGNVDDQSGRLEGSATTAGLCGDSGLGNAISSGRQSQPPDLREHGDGVESSGREQVCCVEAGGHVSDGPSAAGPVNGFWGAADWLLCRDGKWRPVEPGSSPLVDGSAARVGRGRADWHAPAGPEGFGHRAGRLKGYGNAINAEAARIFIGAYMN